MANKIVIMNALFEQVNSFISELVRMYPDDMDFTLAQTTFRLILAAKPALLVTNLKESLLQYQAKIMAKDESFFLTHSYEEHSQYADMDVFSKLKEYVKTMDGATKQTVWAYAQNITKLVKILA